MKKIISVLLALVLTVVAFCGCSADPVGKYVGQYTNSSGDLIEKDLTLNTNNSFTLWTSNLNEKFGFHSENGTYTIEGSQLTLRFGSDSDKEYYEWKGSKIITDDGLVLEKK